MRLHALLALALALAPGCGDDEAPPETKANTPPKAAAAAAAAAANTTKLQPRLHVEDRVACPPVEKATGIACKLEAPACEPGLYCLPTPTGAHCEPCPERESIRHELRDRDFLTEQVRDPFQSFTIGTVIPTTTKTDERTKECTRDDQLVATNYSYQDLKLVGIVAQGTQRKVLMMDTGNLGHIIKRGDCVGKEKAVVKDIGTGYVTFRVSFDNGPNGAQRPEEERSMQLYTGGVEVPVMSAPDLGAPPPTVVTPPATVVPGPGPSPRVAPPAMLPPPPARLAPGAKKL